jgi:hypothetical protein
MPLNRRHFHAALLAPLCPPPAAATAPPAPAAPPACTHFAHSAGRSPAVPPGSDEVPYLSPCPACGQPVLFWCRLPAPVTREVYYSTYLGGSSCSPEPTALTDITTFPLPATPGHDRGIPRTTGGRNAAGRTSARNC